MLPAATTAGLALAALSLWSGVAHAAAGDLDPTFDGDGNFAVWRLNADGSLDRSFDGDGSAAADFQ